MDPRFIASHCVRFQFLFSLPVVNWGIKRDRDRYTRSDKIGLFTLLFRGELIASIL